MTDNKQRLKELLVKRASIKGQLTKFKNYLFTLSNETQLLKSQLAELSLKVAKIDALSVKFDDIQSEIEVLNSDSISIEIDERDTIEQEIISNIVLAKSILESHVTRRDSCCTNHDESCHNDHQEVGLKLPQIQIAKFDGAYFRWLEFRDTFESLIHNNNKISPVHKFHYLISYLQGDAARIISNLEVSSANYADAWKLLCSRYDNKRILINHHLSSLFNVRPLPRESEKSLRFLVDHVTKNLRALSSLGQPTDKWDILIIFMLSSKLDSVTLMKWEEYRNNIEGDVPTLNEFNKFLINRADVLESINRNNKVDTVTLKNLPSTSKSFVPHNSQNRLQPNNSLTKSFLTSNKSITNNHSTFHCIICSENHKIYDCSTFKAKGINERLEDVKKYKLCMNCLRQGHPASECRMGPCRECKKRHNSLLHTPATDNNSYAVAVDERESVSNFSNHVSNQVILSTAIVEVSNPLTSQKVKVRALLDCGSQSSFVSKWLKDKLSLNSTQINPLKVIGIGNNCSNNVVECCNLKINSLNSNFNTFLSCYVLPELTGCIPKVKINVVSLNLPKEVPLADPTFYQPALIDILIGADMFWDVLKSEQRSLGVNNPKLINSQLGWLIAGPMNSSCSRYIDNVNSKDKINCHYALTDNNLIENIDKNLEKFWELEEVPIKSILSDKDKACENHFLTTTSRDQSGRFCVKLPMIESPDCLGDTYNIARRRFILLEKRFRRNPVLKIEYSKFIKEYADLGHLSPSNIMMPTNAYYLCHHAVLKENSESTKLRVVFDGSATSSSGYSLNDILMVGPNVQDSLFSILIRARQYKFLLTGDIEKMYRQVLVHEDDRDLQLILWREDESRPLNTLKLNTVTYGTASASYLSTRCLWQLGEEQRDEFIKTIIQKDFYIDDLITGDDDPNQIRYIQKSVSNALRAGCFNLRKFKTNLPNLLGDGNKDELYENLTISESKSTLGLGWNPSSDTLFFPIKNISEGNDITKRFIMSNSFKLFDPLGLLSPFVVQPKLMLQKLWQLKLDWDEPVPIYIKNDWQKFVAGLKYLINFKIPRHVIGASPKLIEMHTFSDASQSAYGACIYMRSISSSGTISVRLLCAKSKIAPLKPSTIPRLELAGALLAARLYKSVVETLRSRPDRIVHWCDSSVVLSWIKTDLIKLRPFVANRIAEIMENTDRSAWRYVATDQNPADLISRGEDAASLVSRDLWWQGPDFLYKNESEWPVLKYDKVDLLPETKSTTVVLSETIIDFNNVSSLNRLERCVAYVKRFIHNLKNPHSKRKGPLSVDELKDSFHYLCMIAQRESFGVEYDLLIKGKPLSTKSKILSLSPFMDKENLIRVGGRLNESQYAYEKKHPILLHSSHRLTRLLFEREHVRCLHAGPQLLLATIRETVWPVAGRILARRTVGRCVRCKRLSSKPLVPKMGDLPEQRINPGFPFLSVGLDFAGPFLILNRKGRGGRLVKCYLCLFVCLRYKCIHLEAVSDLSKEAFIMTLRRFVARRGKPVEIFCDNGRNFVAAAKDLGTFLKNNSEPLSDSVNQEGIRFSFIPAYAAHFGGLWEAGVKAAKHHLRRVLGNSHLTFEEILTLFAQVEAILNSRPLYPLSSSPDDLLSLTPGHFLIGRPLTAVPAQNYAESKESSLNRYARLEKLRQDFWHRWQKEYICELQQRSKWRTGSQGLNINDLVLIQEDHVPPLCWRLGRVVRLFPGPDGIIRVADLKTTKGCVRRPLVRLCPLVPAEETNS